MSVTRIILIRHAENISPTPAAPDPGLTERGVQQRELLARRLQRTHESLGASRLVSSSLSRASQTSEALEPVLQLDKEIEPRLREMDWGKSTGLTIPQIQSRYQSIDGIHSQFGPDGESWSEFVRRACDSLRELAASSAGYTTVLVCHTGVIECSMIEFGRLTKRSQRFQMKPKNTGITEWVAHDATRPQWRLERYNDHQHLWRDGELVHGDDMSELSPNADAFWRAVGAEVDA